MYSHDDIIIIAVSMNPSVFTVWVPEQENEREE
jgi:hypothetical protein